MTCDCAVCRALAGVRIEDATPELVRQLPPDVVDVLTAQGRVLHGGADARDREVVAQAARRCRGGSFEPRGAVH